MLITAKHPSNRSKSKANIVIDRLAHLWHNRITMRVYAVIAEMERSLTHEEAELAALEKSLKPLTEGYRKYMDVRDRIQARMKTIEKLTALVGYGLTPDTQGAEGESPEAEEVVNRSFEHRRNLELWEAIVQYLRFQNEAQVGDILEFFEAVGIKTSRQAVEAAIKAHPRVFRTQKRKREKFISLK